MEDGDEKQGLRQDWSRRDEKRRSTLMWRTTATRISTYSPTFIVWVGQPTYDPTDNENGHELDY